MGVDAKGELHSFDHAGTSVLGGLTRTLTLTNHASGSVPFEVRSFKGLIALTSIIDKAFHRVCHRVQFSEQQ
jgi:hypothetical protein